MLSKLLRWARITKSGDDSGQFPVQQMEYLGKVADGAVVFPYGVHGNIPADVLVLMASVQDSPDNRASLGVLAKKRPTLKDGEVAFYHPPTDAFIIWRESGDLDIETGNGGGANINIKAANVNVNADDVSINTQTVNVTAATSATITAPISTVNGPLTVTGPVIASAGLAITGAITANGVNIGENHRHSQGPDSDGNTEQDTSGVIP